MALSSPRSPFSSSTERTNQWVFSQEIPSDILVQVNDVQFPLHKVMLVAKSGYIRKKILDLEGVDLNHIDLSAVPGGAETFEKAAKFCYGINFEISVHNIAGLWCAAEYLEMTNDCCCTGNLAGRTEEFLVHVAFKTLSGAVIVLDSCESLLPFAEDIGLLRRCVDVVAMKACNESNHPTRPTAEWWATELASLSPNSLRKVLIAMKSLGAAPKSISAAITAFADSSFSDLLLRPTSTPISLPDDALAHHRAALESLAAILPPYRDAPLPFTFLASLLRAATSLSASLSSRREIERRISAALDQASASDLLSLSLDATGHRVGDLESVRRIIAGFVEKEAAAAGGGGLLFGGGAVTCSPAMQKVARTLDAFAAEIAADEDLTVSKFAAVAGALPKAARRFDDDIYRAVDLYLKAHPGLDELEREKVCSVMDPLRLSYEARIHASQNKRLPLQIVLHALYHDQLKLRSGNGEATAASAPTTVASDAALARENALLRMELAKMKMYVSDMQKEHASGSKGSSAKKGSSSFFSSVSKTLGKLNPFKMQGSKDTLNLDDGVSEVTTKPRRRRFSIS
ncbi:putative BTB/POZ domain, NPH3 domain, NPH3/RPT2-like family protein [Dioscorea sansibarensis]